MPHDIDIPYIFIHLYAQLKESAYNQRYIPTWQVHRVMTHGMRIPKELQYPTLTQMEKYGLIRRVHKMKYEILDSDCKPKEDYRDDYQKCIDDINKEKKVKVVDESLYQIIPSQIANKLKKLNVWIFNN